MRATPGAQPPGAVRGVTPNSGAVRGPVVPRAAYGVVVGLAVAVVVLGVVVNLLRPLAPAIGPAFDPQRWFDMAHLARVEAYQTPRYLVALAALLLRAVLVVGIAVSAPGRRLVLAIVNRVGAHRPVRAAAAVALVVLVLVDIAVLPLAFWIGFVHEGAYGFRTQGLGGWVFDWLARHVPTWVTATCLVAAGYALARRLPRAWPVVAGLGGAVLTGLLVFAAPYLLEPLWFDTTPLPDGPVRTAVHEVLDGSGEPIDTLLVADASRRTTKHNAYVSGLGASRRVVLYDTLVADRPADEVAIIVAHELGHQRNRDLIRGTLLGGAGAIVSTVALAGLVRWRARRRYQSGQSDPRGAAVVVATITVLTLVSLPLQSWVSRRAEVAADYASLELTRDSETYRAMQLELARANLSDPDPPTWVRLLWSTHPTPAARLTMGERWHGGDP